MKDTLYSRQIGVIGGETMHKLSNISVLILDLDSIGIEIAKCLCLLGIKNVYIKDRRKIKDINIGRNYVLDSSNKGDTIETNVIGYLKNLNIYVNVECINSLNNIFKDIDVLIQTKIHSSNTKLSPLELNRKCREYNVKYILSCVIGLTGYIFTDFGMNHKIFDLNGEKQKSAYISCIEKVDNDINIRLAEENHDFNSGDKFVFMEEEIDGIYEIKDLKQNNFKIKDNNINLDKLLINRNILIKEYKSEIVLNYRSLVDILESSKNPDVGINLDNKDIKSIMTDIYDLIKNNTLLNNNDYYTKSIVKCKYEFPIICSIVGGIVSNEIIKITGKYVPINQELLIDYSELYDCKNLYKGKVEKEKRDIYNLLSKDVLRSFERLNIFLAGCGALGCEYLKLFSMLNIGINKSGGITVSDNDKIELSNLNRQFLFRNEDIGEYKSVVARNKILKFNERMRIRDLKIRIEKKSEDIFNKYFWEKQDIVVNALDNVETRQYVDSRCILYKKALFECGTLGEKCNIQVIIPNLTKSYSETQDPEEKMIPFCTIKNFPNRIEHCIEWSLEIFNKYFTELIRDINELVLRRENFINYINSFDNESVINEKLMLLNDVVEGIIENDSLIIGKLCVKMYDELFISNIKQLLHIFPEDKLNEDESKFWSGSKILPMILEINDKNSLNFIINIGEMLCRCLKIEFNGLYLEEKLINYIEKEYKTEMKINDNYEVDNNLNIKYKNHNFTEINNILVKELLKKDIKKDNKLVEIFDKDNNDHVRILNIISNLRAKIYKIKEIDDLSCKLIAGRIVPALSTTTTVVTALSMMEIIKYVFNNLEKEKRKIEHKDSFINLGINLYVESEPQKAKKIISGSYDTIMGCKILAKPECFTNWDMIEIYRKKDGIENIKDILRYLKKKYDIDCNILRCDNKILYNCYIELNLNKRLYDIYKELSLDTKEYILLNISSFDENSTPILSPLIKYSLL